MPITAKILPRPKARKLQRRWRVVAFVYDRLRTFEFACVAEVFGLTRPELNVPWYHFETCSADGAAITATHGIRIVPGGGLEKLVRADIVIIPGWHALDVVPDESIVKAIRAAHAAGATLVSICSGSFVLAATGLLDGRRAATHWRYANLLQAMYPKINVDPKVLYVDENRIMTSAGSAAALDLCLHIVRRDYGHRVANFVARGLVVSPHRDGGQAQFIDQPVQHSAKSSNMSAVLEAMQREPASARTVGDWARAAAMSPRTFMRRFKAATGLTPGEWMAQVRIERASRLLEDTDLSMDEIAESSGFGSAPNLRHHFRRTLGITPQAYRLRFNATSTAG